MPAPVPPAVSNSGPLRPPQLCGAASQPCSMRPCRPVALQVGWYGGGTAAIVGSVESDGALHVCCRRPLARGRHHCRLCGNIFCTACCSSRVLLPPNFRAPEPERACDECAALLAPLQPFLAGAPLPPAAPCSLVWRPSWVWLPHLRARCRVVGRTGRSFHLPAIGVFSVSLCIKLKPCLLRAWLAVQCMHNWMTARFRRGLCSVTAHHCWSCARCDGASRK